MKTEEVVKIKEKSPEEAKGIPTLQLSGSWLEAIGFKVGGQVLITIESGQIIINAL